MTWYEDHIEHGDDVRRPTVSVAGIGVHRIISQLEKGHIPQEIVQNYHGLHRVLSEIQGTESEVTVESSDEFSVPDVTNVHIEAAIDFTKDHPELIQEIQQEQETLDNATVFLPPEEAHDLLQSHTFEHFDVTSTFEHGEEKVEFDIQ